MPIYERRYFLGKLLKTHTDEQERIEKLKNNDSNSSGKGKRTKSVSGDALKTMFNSGQIPLK